MTKNEKAISIEMLHQLLILDNETGTMTWKKRDERFFSSGKQTAAHNCAIWNGKFAGKSAMSHKQGMGYLHGCLFNKKFLAHRVVYALHHGKWPDGELDHINGIKTDNRPQNLRSVNHMENMRNQKLRATNTSGINGVSFDKKRNLYEAHISVNSKKVSLGRFKTAEEAELKRLEADNLHNYHENHGRAA